MTLCLQSFAGLCAPTFYGEDFIRFGASWEEGGEGWQELAGATPGPAEAKPYMKQLEALELRDGPYADGLAEPLAALGRYYRRQGEYQEAVNLYRRAMHVVRINDGLYSDRQIPLLRELLVSYREAGDLKSLDQRYDYFFRLYGGGQPPFTELRLRAAREYFRWQREALRRDVGKNSRRLLDLINANEELLLGLQQDVEVDYLWRREMAFSQLKNLYLLLQRHSPLLQESQVLTASQYIGAKPAVAELEEQRMNSLLRSAPAKGADLLKQLMSAARMRGPAEHASVELALGDWYLWCGSKQRSSEAYAAVVAELQGAGESGLLEQWLGTPVELPDNGVFWVPQLIGVDEGPVVRASYDVSSRGRLSQLQTTLISGSEDTSLNSFRRKLSAVLFRPRWVNGEPEAVTGLQRDYQILN